MGMPLQSSPAELRASPLHCVSWDGRRPYIDHVRAADGIATVLQSARIGQSERLEATVPELDCAVLLVRVGSGMRPQIDLPGQPVRRDYRVGEGCLMAPGTHSRWLTGGDPVGGWFHINFSPAALDRLADGAGGALTTIPFVSDPAIAAVAQMFFDLAGSGEAPGPLLWQSLGHVLIWRLSRLGPAAQGKVLPRGGLAPWQVRRTTEYLADNLGRRVSLDELAAVARLSPFHFARAFTRSVGMPPYRYQRKLRIERACELLARSEMRIIDVALMVGYESPQALARVFTQAQGMTPSDWRRRHKGG
ncbi:AraC family transcriptional regulator [Erythrobacter oryzae]|uniref:AraC family transcriptional regulator n=1 Tax=Erythrobacter oryzae TaxID=3019556 RepID=UPI002553FCE4|nr:AraC family transcriptional regulator [Erythrobacter sp. COR-2]